MNCNSIFLSGLCPLEFCTVWPTNGIFMHSNHKLNYRSNYIRWVVYAIKCLNCNTMETPWFRLKTVVIVVVVSVISSEPHRDSAIDVCLQQKVRCYCGRFATVACEPNGIAARRDNEEKSGPRLQKHQLFTQFTHYYYIINPNWIAGEREMNEKKVFFLLHIFFFDTPTKERANKRTFWSHPINIIIRFTCFSRILPTNHSFLMKMFPLFSIFSRFQQHNTAAIFYGNTSAEPPHWFTNWLLTVEISRDRFLHNKFSTALKMARFGLNANEWARIACRWIIINYQHKLNK